MSENTIESFLALIQNHMNTEEILRVMTRHILDAIFQMMRAAVKLSQRVKTIEKNCFTPKDYFLLYNTIKSPWKSRQVLKNFCFEKFQQ